MGLSKWQAMRNRGDNESHRMDGRRMGFEHPAVPYADGYPDGDRRGWDDKEPMRMGDMQARYGREMNDGRRMRLGYEAPRYPGYEEPVSRQRYPRYKDGRFRPVRGSMIRMGEDEDEDEDDDHGGQRRPIHAGGTFWMEQGGQEAVQMLSREQADRWVQQMTAPEGGKKWTYEEVKAMAQKAGITEEKKVVELYAVANAMKSDYGKVAQKYGVGDPMFFLDMARAFVNDSDARLHKTALYYRHIVAR